MNDIEADEWLLKHGEYELGTRIGMSTFGVKRRGGAADEYVGFVVPDTMPHPEPTEVKRFLTRWFVNAYGA